MRNPRYRNSAEYRRNRELVLSQSDLCGICGHRGAQTCDHIIPWRLWPKDQYGEPAPGFDDLGNLQPAHGMLSNPVRYNRCTVCRRLCNESKHSDLIIVSPRSRRW